MFSARELPSHQQGQERLRPIGGPVAVPIRRKGRECLDGFHQDLFRQCMEERRYRVTPAEDGPQTAAAP